MKIKEIKNKLLKWKDFYGQDIADTEGVKNAKTQKELKEILYKHRDFLEMQNIDATQNLDNFIADLGLTWVD